MGERAVSVSRFKAECLALFDEVQRSGQEFVITKRGEPVARVVPIAEPPSLIGSVTQPVDDDALLAPIEDRWHAERG